MAKESRKRKGVDTENRREEKGVRVFLVIKGSEECEDR